MKLLLDPIAGRAEYLLADGTRTKPAGSCDKDGYTIVRYAGRPQKLHRVLYAAVYGPIPKGLQVDHRNGVRSDNRITNLRLLPNALNAQNRQQAHASSKTGVKGVSWKPHIRKFIAQLCVGSRVKHIGSYKTIAAARSAYAKAAAKWHTHNPTAKE